MKPLYICNAKNMSEHCLTQCFHGKPHKLDRDFESKCNKPELCKLNNNKRAVKVQCRKLTKRELR